MENTPKITNVDLNKELGNSLTFKNTDIVEKAEMQNYAPEGQLTEIQERQTQIEKLNSRLNEIYDAWNSLNKEIEDLYVKDTYSDNSSIELGKKILQVESQISYTEKLMRECNRGIAKNNNDIDKLISSN